MAAQLIIAMIIDFVADRLTGDVIVGERQRTSAGAEPVLETRAVLTALTRSDVLLRFFRFRNVQIETGFQVLASRGVHHVIGSF